MTPESSLIQENDPLKGLVTVTSIIITVAGMVFNLAFMWVIVKHSPSAINTYSLLLFNFAFFDFISSFCSATAMQRVLFSGWSITYVFNGPCGLIHSYFCYLDHCINCFVFAHSQWILMISFIYRYYILIKPTPTKKSIICICCIATIISIVPLGPYSVLNTPEEELRITAQLYHPQYNLTGLTFGGNVNLFDWSTLFAVSYMVLPCPFIYLVILIFRYKTLSYLSKATASLSESTKKAHKQLIKALTIQSIIPSFYLLGAAQYTIGILHIASGYWLEHGTFLSMELMPLFSPLIALYFISPYKKAILQIVTRSSKIFPLIKPNGSSTATNWDANPQPNNQISLVV